MTALCYDPFLWWPRPPGLRVDVPHCVTAVPVNRMASAFAIGSTSGTTGTAILMADAMRKRTRGHRFTLGADKAYDSRDLMTTLQAMNITAHVAQNNKNRRSAIDGRTTRHRGYALSQFRWPVIERAFGWLKAVAGMRKVKLRGLEKVSWLFQYAVAAYNLWRIPRLRPAGA